MRVAAASGAAVLAFFGLLTWEIIALAVSFTALAVASFALIRSGERDAEVAAWRDAQVERAQTLGAALTDDLRED